MKLAQERGARFLYQPELLQPVLFDFDGSPVSDEENARAQALAKALTDQTDAIAKAALELGAGGRDTSVAEGIAVAKRALVEPGTRLDRLVTWWLHDQEQFMGTFFEHLSLLHWNDTDLLGCLPGPDLFVANGVGRLISTLAEGLDVRTAHRAVSVALGLGPDPSGLPLGDREEPARGPGGEHVAVACGNGATLRAGRVVCTVPLGVLKTETPAFSPPLPPAHRAAIRALGVGVMNKIVLFYSEAFWGPSLVLGYAGTQPGECPWFLSLTEALGVPALICFLVGHIAVEAERLDDAGVGARAHAALQKMYPGKCPASPARVIATRWNSDPDSLGSWTVYAPGSSAADARALAAPAWDGRLLFAGEHVADLEQGCVHGALLTGKNAADWILSKNASVVPAKL